MKSLAAIVQSAVFVIWTIGVEGTGTLKAVENANLQQDATELNEALGFWDSKQGIFLKILPHRSCKQRKEIYNQMSPEDRDDSDYYNESDGDISVTVMHSFFCETAEYYRTWMYYGMQTEPFMDTQMLTELLILLSFEEQNIKKEVLAEDAWVEYWNGGRKTRYLSPSLLDDWAQLVDDDFGHWGTEMLKRPRNTDKTTNQEAAKADASALIAEMKTDFNSHRLKLDEILAERSAEQAQLVLNEFKIANENKELETVIEDQLGGDVQKAYLDLIKCIREGRANYLAIRLKEVMDGAGTDDLNLSRLIVHLSENDLVEVRAAYEKKYPEEPLRSRIKGETSGFTRDFLFGFMSETP